MKIKKGLVVSGGENIFIYSLAHPFSGEIRYVGQTKQKLGKRLGKHIVESKNDLKKTHNHSWIKSLLNEGLKPKIELIDIVDEKEWIFWEQHYISLFKSWGYNLNNHTIGGEGRIGIEPWNKGTKGVCKPNSGSFKKGSKVGYETKIKKGNRLSPKTEFKKGYKPPNSKLNHSIAENIRNLRKEGIKIRVLSEMFDVKISVIKDIIYNRTYLK